MRVILIDLDGSVDSGALEASLSPSDRLSVIPARDLAAKLRIVASPLAMAELKVRLRQATGAQQAGERFHLVFLGSGDFHHVCIALIERYTEPVTVVHVDNHPDWVTFPNTLNCGSWVNHALRLPKVAHVVTVGPAGADLEWPELKGGNLRAVLGGKLCIVPWRPIRSRVLRRYGDTRCWRQRKGVLYWNHASGGSTLESIVAGVPTRAVHLTIDKDALCESEATTNWDQGRMSISEVEALSRRLACEKTLLGIDVCGDYSPPRFADPFRRLLAALDHPRRAPTDKALAINASTNARLVTLFREIDAIQARRP